MADDATYNNLTLEGVLLQTGSGDSSFAGRLGIGTAPGALLHVNHPTNETVTNVKVGVIGVPVLNLGYLSGGAAWNSPGFIDTDDASRPLALQLNGGKVGIGTAWPTGSLAFDGTTAKTIQMERRTGQSNDAFPFTLRASGASQGQTDATGGDLYLSAGIATGQGTSNIYLQGAGGGASGSADRAPATVLAVLGSGRVGIGTLLPVSKLHVLSSGTDPANLRAESSGAEGAWAGLAIQAGPAPGVTTAYVYQVEGDSKLRLAAGGPDRMVIDATTGRVGIGNLAPEAKLHVSAAIGEAGEIRADSVDRWAGLTIKAGPNTPVAYVWQMLNDGTLRLWAGGQDRMLLDTYGKVGIGTPPAAQLHVKGDRIRLESADGAKRVELRTDGSTVDLQSIGAPLYVNASESQQNTILNPNGGRVGIGKELPDALLHVGGDVKIDGNFNAANVFKQYDSGWFSVGSLATTTLTHNLGSFPKHVSVWCAQSTSPTSPSLAGPFIVNSSGVDERGAYVAKCTTTTLVVRSGNHIGINEANNGWLTSGYYRVIAWA